MRTLTEEQFIVYLEKMFEIAGCDKGVLYKELDCKGSVYDKFEWSKENEKEWVEWLVGKLSYDLKCSKAMAVKYAEQINFLHGFKIKDETQ